MYSLKTLFDNWNKLLHSLIQLSSFILGLSCKWSYYENKINQQMARSAMRKNAASEKQILEGNNLFSLKYIFFLLIYLHLIVRLVYTLIASFITGSIMLTITRQAWLVATNVILTEM